MKLRGAVLWGVLAASAAEQRPVVELEKLLSKPLSPGVLALLIQHAADPRTHSRFIAGIKDPRPEVRTAAARAVHVASLRRGVVTALDEALRAETDPEAAREQIRALGSLSGGSAEAAMREVAKRFAGRLDADLLEVLARVRGTDALPVILADDWAKTVSARRRAELIVIAARGQEQRLQDALRSLVERKDAATWNALFSLYPRSRQPPVRALMAGLESEQPEIAGPTAWHLADRIVRQTAAASEVISSEWKAAADSDPDTAFAFELLARSIGKRSGPRPEWIRFLKDAKASLADDLGPESPMLSLLEPDEREALRQRYDRRASLAGRKASKATDWDPRPSTKEASPPTDSLMLRTPSGLPRGIAADTIAVAGCEPSRKEAFGAAQIVYNREGIPLEVAPIPMAGPKSCQQAATALFLMTLAPLKQFPLQPRPQILIAMEDPDCAHEMEEPAVPASPLADEIPVDGSGEVKAPKLKRKVQPEYPLPMSRSGIGGVVILQAIISRDGCVQEIETKQGVNPMLDYAAARAVSQWRYRPAILDGKPVRVYLTVTVTFNAPR